MQWSRREFGGALALAASGSTARAQEGSRRVGYCIVGLGRISMQHFMPAIRASRNSRVVALVSGHRAKAESMARDYGIGANAIYSYGNYDAIAGNKDIDAVYIALPNSMHAEYTIRAAKAGKHVLCEKPMATRVADGEAMIGACRAAGKKLMIAYRCQYDPAHLRMIDLIRQGKLGKIEAIESAFGFRIAPGEWRLDRTLAGGGPLMDVGIYCLNACRYLTGEEPAALHGYSSVIDRDGRFNQVEENLTWTMKFPSGAVASCNTTYGANMTGFFRVYGSRGMIQADPAFNYDGLRWKAQMENEPPIEEKVSERDPAQFVREADHMAQCILENRTPKTPGEEGLRDLKLMMGIYKSCSTV